MSQQKLSLEVILEMLDKTTAPLRKITQSNTKASKQLRETRDRLKQLQAQQGDIRGYRKAAIALKKQQRELTKYNQVIETNKAKQYEQEQAHSGLKSQLKATKSQYAKLSKALADGTGKGEEFHAELQRTKHALEQHQASVDRSSDKLRGYQKSTTKANAKIKALSEQQKKAAHNVEVYGKKLKDAGISTDNLSKKNRTLKSSVSDLNTQYEKQKRTLEQIAIRQKQMAKVRSAGGEVRSQVGRLAGQGTVAAAAGGYFFKTQFLDTAAQFEDFEAVLKAVEGSSKKARKSLDWVSNFAATTPFQMDKVTEAYVQLRSYGLDPTNGLLKTLGDTSAAMNKPILQAVEAIADAVMGENERLKELGISASTAKGMVTYEYTDKEGNQQSLSVAKDDRKAIEETLKTIWNAKYAGAMNERSKTWNGMVSNMGDQWTRFKNMVMQAGLFDWMKGTLGELLNKVNQMAADGRLQALAKHWGTNLKDFAVGLWSVVEAVSSVMDNIADFVGGWENLIYIMLGLKLLPLIFNLANLTSSLAGLIPIAARASGVLQVLGISTASTVGGISGALTFLSATAIPAVLAGLKAVGAFMLTNPLGWLITGIAVVAFLIYKYWGPIKAFLSGFWDGLIQGLSPVIEALRPLGAILSAIWSVIKWIGSGIGSLIGGFMSMLEPVSSTTAELKELTDAGLTFGKVVGSAISFVMAPITATAKALGWLSSKVKNFFDDKPELKQAQEPVTNINKRAKKAGAELALAGAVSMPSAALDDLQAKATYQASMSPLDSSQPWQGQPVVEPKLIKQKAIAQLDSRPPLKASKQITQDNSLSIGEIRIQAAPGMDEQALAQMVAKEIQKVKLEQMAAKRSNLYDED